MQTQKILNSKGEPIVLNARESRIAEVNQRLVNALGYELNVTTLTTIIKKVAEQKFFQIKPSDYLPVIVGEGAWSTNLIHYRSFDMADDFETGIINTGSNNSRLAQGDAGVDSLSVKIVNWAKAIGWSIFDLELAAKSGNWDLVSSKEKARKKNWDLGVQKIAFLGMKSDPSVLGLYNQPGVTFNTSLLSGPIGALAATPQSLSRFIGSLLAAYRVNCNKTAWPTTLIVPESDYLTLATPSSATYPIKSILELMKESFTVMTGNRGFEILPCAYGDVAFSSGVLSKQTYVLLNKDEESIRMTVPVDYTNTLANSIDNFSFQNAGYGQFTGVLAYRPLELLYFGF